MGQIVSKWEKSTTFSDSDFSTFWLRRAKMYWNLIWKSHASQVLSAMDTLRSFKRSWKSHGFFTILRLFGPFWGQTGMHAPQSIVAVFSEMFHKITWIKRWENHWNFTSLTLCNEKPEDEDNGHPEENFAQKLFLYLLWGVGWGWR